MALRILHLEDSAEDAFLIKRALSDHNLSVEMLLARTRQEFEEALQSGRPDVILADSGVPGFGGLEALRMARDRNPEIPFVCLSGSDDRRQIEMLFREGASDFIQKDQTLRLASVIRMLDERRDLKEKVETRNAQLKAANDELESVAYAVSHDLGAPLRCIRGYCELLSREYSNALDSNGKTYLSKALDGARQMREFMDDLVRMSRVTQGEMRLQPVNLTELAREILRQLQASAPERVAEVSIADNLETHGDRGLLRIVMENLLSNAWKFTSNTPVTRIEVGVTGSESERREFFVRDNGAGFEMEYVDKLFRPFRRLHTIEEFPGSGIGLCTAKRIISRHGGNIRAAGNVGEGATFYFTIGAK
ncbi:MAG TPA: ATP-binding protein [Verrucomicrobiae bacterium]|nr:ATP-binding protein [Verrucomicrobiae bacterium]